MSRILKLWNDTAAYYHEQITNENCPFLGVHDLDHIVRVLNNANQLIEISWPEPSPQMVEEVQAAAILHDIGYCQLTQHAADHQVHIQYSIEISQIFLTNAAFTSTEIADIQNIILSHHSLDHANKTIQEKILYLADKLDMIGLDGILRMFIKSSYPLLNRDKIATSLLEKYEKRVNDDLLKIGIGQELVRLRWLETKQFLNEILQRGVLEQEFTNFN